MPQQTQVKVTAEGGFTCAPNGHTVVNFPKGTILDDQLAEWAIADKKAARIMQAPESKVVGPKERKGKGK